MNDQDLKISAESTVIQKTEDTQPKIRVKEWKYWFIYADGIVKENPLTQPILNSMKEAWVRTNSVFEYMLVNNYYTNIPFIITIILAILVKVIFIRKSLFMNEVRNLEYEFYIINASYSFFFLCYLLWFPVYWFLWLWVSLWYIIYLHNWKIVEIIQQIIRERNFKLKMNTESLEADKEILKVELMDNEDIVYSNLLQFKWSSINLQLKLGKKIFGLFLNKMYSSFMTWMLLILWFTVIYMIYILIMLYFMWENWYLLKGKI